MQATISQDKRALYRLPSTLCVEITIVETGQVSATSLRNISPGGMRLASARPYARQELLEVGVPVVDPGFAAEAEVIWCRLADGGDFETGLRFADAFGRMAERIYGQLREIETFRQTVRDFEGRDLTSDEAAREWRRRFSGKLFS